MRVFKMMGLNAPGGRGGPAAGPQEWFKSLPVVTRFALDHSFLTLMYQSSRACFV